MKTKKERSLWWESLSNEWRKYFCKLHDNPDHKRLSDEHIQEVLELKSLTVNDVGDLYGIRDLIHLEQLVIEIKTDSLKELEHLKNLRWLDCIGCELQNIDGIQDLTRLEHLNVSCNQVASLRGIRKLIKLREVYCRSNKIQTLEGFEDLAELKILFIEFNQLNSLKGIKNCQKLITLDCSWNKINSLEEIANLPLLEELCIEGNSNLKFEQLMNVSSLDYLRCDREMIFPWMKELKVLRLHPEYIFKNGKYIKLT